MDQNNDRTSSCATVSWILLTLGENAFLEHAQLSPTYVEAYERVKFMWRY